MKFYNPVTYTKFVGAPTKNYSLELNKPSPFSKYETGLVLYLFKFMLLFLLNSLNRILMCKAFFSKNAALVICVFNWKSFSICSWDSNPQNSPKWVFNFSSLSYNLPLSVSPNSTTGIITLTIFWYRFLTNI